MRTSHLLRSPRAGLLAACVVLAGCHSTHLAATWRDPSVSAVRFQKPITIFVTKSDVFRRIMEDRLAARLPHGEPSYKVLKSVDADGTVIRQELATAGFDGAIIMRVAEVQDQVYATGAYWNAAPYYSFAGGWRSAWGYPYDPYLVSDVVVTIETQVYTLADDKLIWAARSETTNPASVKKLCDSVIKHVLNRLQKDNLVLTASLPSDSDDPRRGVE